MNAFIQTITLHPLLPYKKEKTALLKSGVNPESTNFIGNSTAEYLISEIKLPSLSSTCEIHIFTLPELMLSFILKDNFSINMALFHCQVFQFQPTFLP
jgi:hypothetical protein